MTTTREEAMEQIAELKKEVLEEKETFEREVAEWTKQVDGPNGTIIEMQGKVNKVESENAQLSRKLEGYSGLQKALGQMPMPHEVDQGNI